MLKTVLSHTLIKKINIWLLIDFELFTISKLDRRVINSKMGLALLFVKGDRVKIETESDPWRKLSGRA